MLIHELKNFICELLFEIYGKKKCKQNHRESESKIKGGIHP